MQLNCRCIVQLRCRYMCSSRGPEDRWAGAGSTLQAEATPASCWTDSGGFLLLGRLNLSESALLSSRPAWGQGH